MAAPAKGAGGSDAAVVGLVLATVAAVAVVGVVAITGLVLVALVGLFLTGGTAAAVKGTARYLQHRARCQAALWAWRESHPDAIEAPPARVALELHRLQAPHPVVPGQVVRRWPR